MPLYQRRKRQRERAMAVADGQTFGYTTKFPPEARLRILYAMGDCTPQGISTNFNHSDWDALAQTVRSILLREWGRGSLAQGPNHTRDLEAFVGAAATDEEMLDAIEAYFVALRAVFPDFGSWAYERAAESFTNQVNEILDDYDIGYQVVSGELLPRSSMAMHATVVAPVLSLLHGDARLSAVEKAFQDALGELKPSGDSADAITDAGTALQEMLQAVGAQGNALGSLLSDARRRGLLGPYDSKLAEGVQAIGTWVSADRSSRGDAHSSSDATRDDAWLAVHVAGALILRLEKRLPQP